MLFENINAPITIVLHHPHFFDHTYWQGWSELTGCNIISFDAPHHGNNTHHADYHTFAHTTTTQATELTNTPLIVAGVSQGGVIAQEASTHPRVVGIAGIATTRTAATADEKTLMEHLIASWEDTGPSDDIATAIAENATNSHPENTAKMKPFVAAMTKASISQSVPLLLQRRGHIPLACPSMFIHGTQDHTYSIRDLEIPQNSHLLPIDGASHSLPLEYPRLIGSVLGHFARSLIEQ